MANPTANSPSTIGAGGSDHTVPAVVDGEAADHYSKSSAITAYKEFPGRSPLDSRGAGLEKVADHALDCALENARSPVPA
jgi:hypothetical protein